MAANPSDKEVSGSVKTLIEAIDDGEIAKPADVMSLNEFIRWRSKEGRRPHKATDGVSSTPKQEALLWRDLMKHLFGEEWQTLMAMREAELAAERAEGQESPREPDAQGARGSGSSAEAATSVRQGTTSTGTTQESSVGAEDASAGGEHGAAGDGDDPRNLSPRSGHGFGTPRGGWDRDNVPQLEDIKRMAETTYDPEKETLEVLSDWLRSATRSPA